MIHNKYLVNKSNTFLTGAKQTRYSSPVLSVKRSFRLKNTGLTPIWFAGFDVEGVPCEGYGFKVLNCEGFNLEPSGTKDIDIAFSPDFTLSRVARQLTLRTSINGGMSVQETGGIHTRGLVNYTLVATLPSHMLAVCGSILPRPGWESYLFYSINIFMCFALVVVLVSFECSFLDIYIYYLSVFVIIIVIECNS